MAERLTFVLDGRDDLSRVLGHAGDSALRLRDTMTDATDGSNRALLTLTRDADGRLRDLQGRFVNAADAARLLAHHTGSAVQPMADWATAADRSRKVGERLRGMLISLAPAAIPAAAAMAPLVAATAAGGVAVGVYAVALAGQISALSEASQAEKKYTEAVAENGARSKEAVEAQVAYTRAVSKLPPATREATAALSVFKDEYKEWSNSLAEDTTGPMIKGLGAVSGLLPKLSPLVRGTSTELDRMMTLLAGGIQSPGFDRVMRQFTEFSTGVLRRMNDGILTLSRTLDTGEIGDGFTEFMEFAREHGPLVADVMQSIGRALANVLEGASGVGVGMLTFIDAIAGIVAAVPPGAISALLQLAIAIKLVNLAAAGFAAGRALVAAFAAQLVTMRTAAAAAPGPLAAAGAAMMTLSRTARLAIAGTGIGLLIIALTELLSTSEEVPPDVDKMTSSLAKLGATGKNTGLALETFGKDFSGLRATIDEVLDPSVSESIDNWLHGLSDSLFVAGEATEKFTADVDSVDKALASMASGGKADLAAAALEHMLATMNPEQAEKFRGALDEYDTALQNLALEQQLVAQSMGLFGAQAQQTQVKLDAQKASADGLRQSIIALNDVNRAGLGAMNAFEASIDNAAKAAAENGRSLRMVGGELDLNSEKARNNEAALRDLAAKTDEAAAAAREQGKSWEFVNAIQERGRAQFLASAQAMGLTRQQAQALADQINRTPNKTAYLRGNMEDLEAKLAAAKRKLATVPDARKAQVRAEIYQLEQAIAKARRELDNIDGKRAHTYVITHLQARREGAHGTELGGRARGGLVPGYAGGGMLQAFPQGGFVTGPGSTMSDSILALMGSGSRARVSNREYVIRAAAVSKYGVAMFDALNAMRLPVPPPTRARAMGAPMGNRPVPVAEQAGAGSGGGMFQGDLYLDSGEFLGAVRGVVRPMLRESEQQQARRAKKGRAL